MEQTEISEKILLQWFKKNVEQMQFVVQSSEIKKELMGTTHKTSLDIVSKMEVDDLSLVRPQTVSALWKELLGDAVLYLKHEDQREEIHDTMIHGVDRLEEYFEEFRKFEDVLFGSGRYYRSHVSHVLRVFILGEYIIRKRVSSGFDWIRILPSPDELTYPKDGSYADVKEAMWCIIALTHDLGIPLEKLDRVNASVREMMKWFGKLNVQEFAFAFPSQNRFIDDFIVRFISSKLILSEEPSNAMGKSYQIHLQPKFYLKFSRAFENFNHGLVGCILLMRNLVYFLESDYVLEEGSRLDETDAFYFQIRREILRAIASHSCEEIYHLKVDNFHFLLMLLDDMQQWHRPIQEERINLPFTESNRLYLDEFGTDKIRFTILLDLPREGVVNQVIENPKEHLDRKLVGLFLRAIEKYNKTLRSGIGGKYRLFDFGFTIRSELSNFSMKYEHGKSKSKEIQGKSFYNVTIQGRDGDDKPWRDIDLDPFLKLTKRFPNLDINDQNESVTRLKKEFGF
ncbi:MAG: hypothetical protein KAR39_02890 [Thermoplasmata archaeon]|nr:hypothetical protein [Thermoplasmata archaeon]